MEIYNEAGKKQNNEKHFSLELYTLDMDYNQSTIIKPVQIKAFFGNLDIEINPLQILP